MSEADTPKKYSRRDINKLLLGVAGGVAIAAATESIPLVNLGYEHTIKGTELKIMPMWRQEKKPFVSKDGSYFDLTTSKFVSPDSKKTGRLLLSELPTFNVPLLNRLLYKWRDSKITPELVLNNNKLTVVKDLAQSKLDKWIHDMTKPRNSNQSISENVNDAIDFTPSELLILRQINHALAQTFVYENYSPEEFDKLTLDERLEKGKTNCFEYTLAAAMAYAHSYKPNLPGIASNIGYFTFDRKDKETGEIKHDAHVFNIINHNNSCVVTDLTVFGADPLTFKDYIERFTQDGRTLTSPIMTTSIIADESYPAFPYNSSEWLNAETPLGLRASYDPSFGRSN